MTVSVNVLRLIAVCVVLGAPVAAAAQSSLPNPDLTPGAINPAVMQDNIDQTICVPGWTHTIRPPREYTEELKRQQIREYGYADRRLRDYEEDHLIPLALGGAPEDPRNLWPEPRWPADGWLAEMKDDLEAALARLVCSRQVPLDVARDAIASNWHEAYQHFVEGG